MRFRSMTLRTNLLLLVVALIALWSFAAWVTVRDGLNLFWVQTLNTKVYEPSEPLIQRLQEERRLSAVYLGSRGQSHAALDAKRGETDAAAAAWKRSAESWQAGVAGSDNLDARINEVATDLNKLVEARALVDSRSVDRATAATTYTSAIDAIFTMYRALGNLDDKEIADTTATLIEVNRVWEILSQEDALLAGTLAAGRMTSAEHTRFVQLVGLNRFQAAEAAAKLPAAARQRYDQAVNGTAYSGLRKLEDRAVDGGTAGALRVSANDWQTASERGRADLHAAVVASGSDLVQRAVPVAAWVMVRLIVATGLGLVTVLIAMMTARRFVWQMEQLRDNAHELADKRLPGVVDRLQRGEDVDVASEAPSLDYGPDEIGQLGQAFNAVQETAIRVAVEQSELRRGVRDVFLNISRRSQTLVHRQLGLLSDMQQQEEDPEVLEALFRIDHLSTRMRRNAENLIVLAGGNPPRAWRRNVPMIDVVRGAIAEVEDYTRVTALPMGATSLAGRAVADMIHLLAELIENALSFSPPTTTVNVKGQMVANGYVIEIEDRGLGMVGDELAAANEQIAAHAEFRPSANPRLGLFVISRLAKRLNARVHLKESPFGGTTAVVLIAADLVADGEDPHALPAGPTARAVDEDTRPLAVVAANSHAAAEPGANELGSNSNSRPASSRAADSRPADFRPVQQHAPASSEITRQSGDAPAAGGPATNRTALTEAGLPKRVRRPGPPAAAQNAPTDPIQGPDMLLPDPHETLRKMSSYQRGTRRGRAEAAELHGQLAPASADQQAEGEGE